MATDTKRPSLLLLADTPNGGLAAAVRAEAEWFAARGWAVTVGACRDLNARGAKAALIDIPFRARDLGGILQAARATRRVLRQVEPSIVHAHGTRSLVIARLAGANAFLTLHGLPLSRSAAAGMLRTLFVRLAARLARGAFSVSPELDGGGWQFLVHASPKLSLLAASELPEAEVPLFLWVGALYPGKRPDAFVRAVAEASRAVPLRGMIVGSGPMADSLNALARQLDAPVELAGHVDDMATMYSESAAVVLTSASEGVPFVVEEAMWCGRPVVSSDLVGTRWLLGETGVLVRTDGELVSALVRLSDRTAAVTMGRDCGARVRRLVAADSPWPQLEIAFVGGASDA